MTCSIAASTVERIGRHLEAEYPREGCGLLVGHDLPGERAIEYAVPTHNDELDGHRYAIAPEAFLTAEKAARASGFEVVGFYHSHPDTDPTPSASDVSEAWSHYTYLIVEVRGGRLGSMAAWRFDSPRVVPETIQVHPAKREAG